jgi:hypothetical protein
MLYRGPWLLRSSYNSAPRPSPLPLSRQQVISLSQSSCVFPVELTDGRKGGGVGGMRESLALYKKCNSLCSHRKQPTANINYAATNYKSPTAHTKYNVLYVIGIIIHLRITLVQGLVFFNILKECHV